MLILDNDETALYCPTDSGLFLVGVNLALSTDVESETKACVAINEASFNWLKGNIDTDSYIGMIEDLGIPDGNDFIDEREQYLYDCLFEEMMANDSARTGR